MYEPDGKSALDERKEKSDSGLVSPEARISSHPRDTDRVNGEYHYKNGYTQKIYSDAHYVPAGESTVPPRYYSPPGKPVREPKPPREKKPGGGAGKIFLMCMVCALLGGFIGSAVTSSGFEERIALLEQQAVQAQEEALVVSSPQPGMALSSGSALSASQIYERACQEVVGVSTEVTYTNYFGMTSASAVSGTGFIVSENGYIVTNYHVIEQAYARDLEVSVMLHDGSKYSASIIGVEECSDLAVLKIEAVNLSPVSLGDSDSLQVGDDIYAVGNPLGELDFSMSTGHVSALDRLISTDDSSYAISMFQIDAAVNTGNSGGPAYNSRGEVVGIVSAKYSDAGVEGIGFAIPINDAASIVSDLITKGYVTGRAYMGIEFDNRYNTIYSQYYGMPIGAYVYSVESGSCAEEAGLQSGDIITELGGLEIAGYSDIKQAVKQFSAGDTVGLSLYRAGESLELTITFDEAQPDSTSDSPIKISPGTGE